MKFLIIFFLYLMLLKITNESEIQEQFLNLYNFLQFEIPYTEIGICDTGIIVCSADNNVSEFTLDVCWNEGLLDLNEFPSLPYLEKLKIIGTENNYCRKNFTLPNIIFELPRLEILQIENINGYNFPEIINPKSSIKYIEISESNLDVFPVQITKLQNLNTLYIKNSNIGKLPKEFAEFPALEDLVFESNTYQSKELVIPNSLWYLDVSGEGFTSIFKDNYNKNLMAFVCENASDEGNNNNNETITLVGENGQVKTITRKDLNSTLIVDSELENFNEEIFESFSHYNNLKFLYLRNNKLIKRIPSSIKELTSLESLKLNYDNIEEVSEEYFKLPKLDKDLKLKNKKSNPDHLTSFKRCNVNDTTPVVCFDIRKDGDKTSFKTIIIVGLILVFILIVGVLAFILIRNYRKRTKFEKMRQKIIDNVTNEIDKSNSRNVNDNYPPANSYNNDRQCPIPDQSISILVGPEHSSSEGDISNQHLLRSNTANISSRSSRSSSNGTGPLSDITPGNDQSELPTYMDSIRDNPLRIGISTFDKEFSYNEKKGTIEVMVDAEVLNQTVDDYYRDVLHQLPNHHRNSNRNNDEKVHPNNSTVTTTTTTSTTRQTNRRSSVTNNNEREVELRNDSKIAEVLYENEKKPYNLEPSPRMDTADTATEVSLPPYENTINDSEKDPTEYIVIENEPTVDPDARNDSQNHEEERREEATVDDSRKEWPTESETKVIEDGMNETNEETYNGTETLKVIDPSIEQEEEKEEKEEEHAMLRGKEGEDEDEKEEEEEEEEKDQTMRKDTEDLKPLPASIKTAQPIPNGVRLENGRDYLQVLPSDVVVNKENKDEPKNTENPHRASTLNPRESKESIEVKSVLSFSDDPEKK